MLRPTCNLPTRLDYLRNLTHRVDFCVIFQRWKRFQPQTKSPWTMNIRLALTMDAEFWEAGCQGNPIRDAFLLLRQS